MNKLILVFGLIILSATACQKKSQLIYLEPGKEQQIIPVCGLEEAMAAMMPEFRNELARTATTTITAAELLLFLDFDGAVVRSGFGSAQGGNVTSPIVSGTRNCPPPALTMQQQLEIIELVKDDFSPFKIQFTTEQAVYDAYPMSGKQVCIITTFPSVLGFSSFTGGVAPWAGLGNRLFNNPSFVFASVYGNDLKELATTISHEVAHTMGLGHQSLYNDNCNFIYDYHPGFGTGPLSFAPIMGFNGKRVSNWFAQSCSHPIDGGSQNDFVFLNNQVELRGDDFPNIPSGNSTVSATDFIGVLEQAGDIDYIRINFRNLGPVTITSENIDIKASLFTPGGHLLAEYVNPDDTHVTIPSANGMRYLKIEAVSNTNMSSQFMTGRYRIMY